MGQNIFIFVLLGGLVVGFIYLTFIRPKKINTTEEEPKEEVKPQQTPAATSKPKKKKK